MRKTSAEASPDRDPAIALEPLPEVASILATGLRRLHSRCALIDDADIVSSASDSERNCLEVSGETPLHGRRS